VARRPDLDRDPRRAVGDLAGRLLVSGLPADPRRQRQATPTAATFRSRRSRAGLLPFVAIWHLFTNEQLLATIFAALDVGIAYWMLGYLPIRQEVRQLTTLFLAWARSSGTRPP